MNTTRLEAFRTALADDFVVGPFAKTSDPAMIEAIGHAGFDFVILDLEHGPNSVETMQNLIRAAECVDLVPIVRTKEDRLSTIGEVLDIGAYGVQAPQVTSAESAGAIVEHAKFAPLGMRGVCRFVRAAGYSTMERTRYFNEANQALIIVQLEGADALNRLEEILEVPGIDVIFIGPYDLSQSLGRTGEIDHPLVVETMETIVRRCSEKDVCVGTFVDTPENFDRWKNAGVRYLSYSVDVGIFADACRDIVRRSRG